MPEAGTITARAPFDLAAVRSQIPALRNRLCFNSGGVGPISAPVYEAMDRLARLMLEYGGFDRDYRPAAEATAEESRRSYAAELGAGPDEIALMRSVSECLSLVQTGLNLGEGDEVITGDEEHPSGVLPWICAREARGVVLKKVSVRHGPEATLAGFRDAISPRTRLIAISHVTTETGIRLPVHEICRMARERGVLTALDGAQAAGQIPLDLPKLGCDFYVFPTFKWLLGPRGGAIFYLRREAQAQVAQPGAGASSVTAWDLESLTATFKTDAGRFEIGASNLEIYAGALAALRFAQQTGIEFIEGRNLELAAQLKERLKQTLGARVLTPMDPAESAGIVTFSLNGVAGTEVAARLDRQANVQCRPALKGQAVRLSAHYYADQSEIDLVAATVAGMAAAAP